MAPPTFRVVRPTEGATRTFPVALTAGGRFAGHWAGRPGTGETVSDRSAFHRALVGLVTGRENLTQPTDDGDPTVSVTVVGL